MTIILGLDNYRRTPADIRKHAILVCDYDVTAEASVIIMRAIDKAFNVEELKELIDNITSKRRFLMARSSQLYFGNWTKTYYSSIDELINVQVEAGRKEADARIVWELCQLKEKE